MAIDLTGNVCALLIVSITSIILNSFCLQVIRTKKTFRDKPSTIFLVNLLLVHLVQGLIVLPMYAGKSFKDQPLFWTRFFSNGFRISYFLTFYGVCFGVLLISIDRFLATYLLNKYKTCVNRKNALTALLLTWLYTLVLCVIPFVPEAVESSDADTPIDNISLDAAGNALNVSLVAFLPTFSPATTATFVSNNTLSQQQNGTEVEVVRYIRPWKYIYKPHKEWTIFMLFANAALPFLFLVVCYVYIIFKIKKVEATQHKYNNNSINNGRVTHTNNTELVIAPSGSNSNSSNNSSSNNSSNTIKKTKKKKEQEEVKGFKKYKEITYLTLTLSVIYFLLWTPSIIYYTVLMTCERCFPEDWNDSPPEKHIVYVIKFLISQRILLTCSVLFATS